MVESKSLAVGFDLGTTFSVVAHLDRAGRPSTILNSEGDPTTPSVVLFEESGVTVGKEAQKAAALEPDRVAAFAKRDMGEEAYHRTIGGKQVPPEVIQALVLRKLKRDAESKIGFFSEAVITVPAYFNEPRRKATQDAGRLAGLEVLDIINEPTAAAVAYGFEHRFLDEWGEAARPERILVYDLGGGTFDVTVMEIKGNEYNTLSTDGDVYLGGIDWDWRLADLVAEEFQKKFGVDPRKDPAGRQRLLREVEDAKRALSAREQTTVAFEHGSRAVRLAVTREQFESITSDLLERTLFTVRMTLQQAKLTWKDLTRVLVVGGSTRMPAVPRALEELSGLPVDHSISTDEAVAHGAALYAGTLLRSEIEIEDPLAISNVNSHSLGVLGTEQATGRQCNTVVIPRNTPLPTTRAKRFQTGKNNQRSVVIRVIEGGDASGQNSTPIGKCVVRDLPAGLPAGSQVDVLFHYAENGRLNVKARVPQVDRSAETTLQRMSGLNDQRLEQWRLRLIDDDRRPLLGEE